MAGRRTVKDVLVAALRKLERHGWIKDQSGRRSAFSKQKPLTPRHRKKGLVLPLSEPEAQLLRAILGPSSDYEMQRRIEAAKVYPLALSHLRDGRAGTLAIFNRIHRACERRGLAR
jgi:hypothetical protein